MKCSTMGSTQLPAPDHRRQLSRQPLRPANNVKYLVPSWASHPLCAHGKSMGHEVQSIRSWMISCISLDSFLRYLSKDFHTLIRSESTGSF